MNLGAAERAGVGRNRFMASGARPRERLERGGPMVRPGGLPFRKKKPGAAGPGRTDRTDETAAAWFLGRYRILKELGEDGIARVYKAMDTSTGRVVAVKLLRPESATRENIRRFQREIQAMDSLDHPTIPKVYECGTDRGRHYAVVEHLDAATTRALLDKPAVNHAQEETGSCVEAASSRERDTARRRLWRTIDVGLVVVIFCIGTWGFLTQRRFANVADNVPMQADGMLLRMQEAEGHWRNACAFEIQGNYGAAREQLRKAVALAPGERLYREALARFTASRDEKSQAKQGATAENR